LTFADRVLYLRGDDRSTLPLSLLSRTSASSGAIFRSERSQRS